MSEPPSLLDQLKDAASAVRQCILEELKDCKSAWVGQKNTDIDRRVRGLSNLSKSLRDIEEDIREQTALNQSQLTKQHTPYDQLPPPSEEEMDIIRQDLIEYFNRQDDVGAKNGKNS